MARPDLNLLVTLDVLLAEGSVARAARRLQLSPSAMSRALARLRDTMGDPLLVRAGRGLVPTPRAIELREQVRQLVQDAEIVLRPTKLADLTTLKRTFVLRASDGFAESFGPSILARIGREAPWVQLRLLRKLDKDSAPLREGSVDLETGVVDKATGPELRTQPLFRDHFIGIVRSGHALASGPISAESYSAQSHVLVSRGSRGGQLDGALDTAGLERRIVATVDGYSAATALVRKTDLVATVPARHTAGLRDGLVSFALPFKAPEVMISLLWHPRLDGDAAHRWLRECVRSACDERLAEDVRLASVRPTA
ncbi:MAG TPA: LysR family transcriptional regulator [Sphingomicrobium sp.]|jgi:DNA-binding transcriptional LysR family regulator